MAIDPEVEEVLTSLIDTVEERVGEIKTLVSEESARLAAIETRLDQGGAGGGEADLAAVQQQLQAIQKQQAQINGFLTGMLKLMLAKKMITQQEMVEVYKKA